EMLRERRPRAQPVVGADADPSAGGEVHHQRDALLVLGAEDPGAAVDLEKRRAPGRPRAVPVHVELQLETSTPRVDDVPDAFHLGMADRERQDELTPVDPRGELLGDGGWDRVAVRGPERVAEGTLDDALGAPRAREQTDETGPRGDGDHEP